MRISRGAISCWQEKRQLFMSLSTAQKDIVNSWYICSCPSWYLVPELSTFRFCNNFSRRSEFIWVAEEPPLELLFHVSLGSCFSSCLSPSLDPLNQSSFSQRQPTCSVQDLGCSQSFWQSSGNPAPCPEVRGRPPRPRDKSLQQRSQRS